MTEYKVKLPIFEGPLDLLLHLIRQNELEISEISISQITSQYLDYMRMMEALDLEVAGDFLVMAATLLNIKLRALLPASEEEEQAEQEEELDNFMSARQLLARLIEYRKFKEAAYDLGTRAERQAQIFVREVALPAIAEAHKDEEIRGDIDALMSAFSRVLRFVEQRAAHRVLEEEYTVEEKITALRQRLLLEPRLALTELFEQCNAKVEMIVLVLAVLELCRLKELRVRQNDRFGEVFVFRLDSAPEAEYETTGGSKKLAAAAALERAEAEIIANRTGVLDDGELPPDEEEALLDRVLGEGEAAGPEQVPGEGAYIVAANPERNEVLQTPEFDSVADGEEPGLAEIVDLHPDGETAPDQSS